MDKPSYQELEARIQELEHESSERKRIEAELLEKQAVLRQQHINVVRKSIELSDVKRELEDSNYELELIRSELREQNINLVRRSIELSDTMRQLEDKNYDLELFQADLEKALAALQQSEERYRLLVENANDIIYGADANGFLSFMNPVAERMMGYSEQELIGRHYLDMIRPDHRQDAERFYDLQVVKGIPNTYYEFPAVTKNGTELWLGQNVQLVVEDGRVVGFQAVARDITKRVRAEEALRQSEEKYRLLVENANETILVAQNGMLKFFNPKALELSGYSPEELVSTPFSEMVHPDDREVVVERHLGRLKGEALPEVYSFRIIDKSGNTKWVEINVVLIGWEGRPATLNFLSDITERKRTEEALKDYSERLEEMVEQRTLELQETYSDLRDSQARLIQSEKLAATGRLAISVAHEINNPLQGISNYLSVISRKVAQDDPLREDLDMVKLGFERITEIVRRLRAFYRPAGKEMEPTDINGVVERVLALVSHQLSLGQIEVKTELTEHELPVLGSAGQLEQVLVNLALNAQEAMPQGGELTVRTVLREDVVQLQVSDTGHGISEEEMSWLFKPFYSGRGGKGLGLGLWISHNIIEGHGGHIEVQSQESTGTTFTISLPAYQRDKAE